MLLSKSWLHQKYNISIKEITDAPSTFCKNASKIVLITLSTDLQNTMVLLELADLVCNDVCRFSEAVNKQTYRANFLAIKLMAFTIRQN